MRNDVFRRFGITGDFGLAFVMVAAFVLSRIVIRIWLGVLPDPGILENHWQHSDLTWLYNDFGETILYLHSQPPLWNALIGAMTHFLGPDPEAVSRAISVFFGALSLLMMLVFVWCARRAGFSRPVAGGVGLLIAVSPTMIYYENYPFYAHLTAFLVTGLLLAAARMERDRLAPLFAFFAIASVLSLVWAVFHPVFIVFLGVLCLVMYPAARSFAGVATILVALGLSCAPTLRNKALFGQDFASSWLGINLTQTLPDRSEELETYCKFETVVDALLSGDGLDGINVPPTEIVSVDAMVKPSSGYENMNNLLVSERAAECFDIYLQEAPKSPLGYVQHFGERLIASHSTPPFIYAFRPQGWDVQAWVDRLYYKLGPVSEAATVLSYLALVGYALWKIRRGGDRRLYIFVLSIIVYFTFITHFANGGEQQRMRATIEPLYWFLLIGLLADIRTGLSRRPPMV